MSIHTQREENLVYNTHCLDVCIVPLVTNTKPIVKEFKVMSSFTNYWVSFLKTIQKLVRTISMT